MLLLLLACNGYPDAPPPAPSMANTMDTAHFVANRPKTRSSAGAREPSDLKGAASLQEPLSKKGPAVLSVDGDIVEVSWFVNAELVSGGTSSGLAAMWFKKGDRVSAEVVISDGSTRKTLLTQNLEVQNSPPEYTARKTDFRQIDGFVLSAKDADGDKLTWSLKGAPPGMSVNPDTGRLSYQGIESAVAGSFSVRIVVKDDDGAKDVWPLELDVAGGQQDSVKRRYGGGE